MSDIVDEINEIHREVGSRPVNDRETPTVLLRRAYDAPVEDVWNACTDPERIGRWFLPVSGDLKPGGHFRLEGNASGEILRCEPPRLLKVSWLFGEDPDFSEVEVRLTARGEEQTVLELEHVADVSPEIWGHFGPGALGLVWDLTALGLRFHLLGGPADDLAAWRESDEAREFMTRSSEAWGAAYEASGAPAEVAAAAVHGTTSFYVPPREGSASEGEDSA
jgi:hypothetical protein